MDTCVGLCTLAPVRAGGERDGGLSLISSDIGDEVVDCNVSQMNLLGEPGCTLPRDTTI